MQNLYPASTLEKTKDISSGILNDTLTLRLAEWCEPRPRMLCSGLIASGTVTSWMVRGVPKSRHMRLVLLQSVLWNVTRGTVWTVPPGFRLRPSVVFTRRNMAPFVYPTSPLAGKIGVGTLVPFLKLKSGSLPNC